MRQLTLALLMLLMFFGTQPVWKKRNYYSWLIAIAIFGVFIYFLPNLKKQNGFVKLAITLGPVVWLMITFFVDFINFLLINKSNGKRFLYDKTDYLILVVNQFGRYDNNLNRVPGNRDKWLSFLTFMSIGLSYYWFVKLCRYFLIP